MSKHSFARFIGNSYAHVQHGLDQLIEWSVTKLKAADNDPPAGKKQKQRGNKYVRFMDMAARGTLGFVGTLAESYFSKYRELKKAEMDKGYKSTT